MFGLKTKPAEVLSHWYTPVPNFSASTSDFYARIEAELAAHKVPGLRISRVDFSEGGAFSDKRQYLRMTRERLVFDVCAAPFGTNYFYSCRFAELPVKVSIFGILLVMLLLIGFVFLAMMCWPLFLLVPVGVLALRNSGSMGLGGLDAFVAGLPLIGPLYERFLRKETYYRQDTRLMYLTVVEGVVKRLVEEETASKGIKLLTEYEYAPILGDLYKPKSKTLDAKVVKPPPIPANVTA
jgi:hypothetical protein